MASTTNICLPPASITTLRSSPDDMVPVQALARRYALSTDSIDTVTAEWLGIPSPRAAGASPGSGTACASSGLAGTSGFSRQLSSQCGSPRASTTSTPVWHRASCDNATLSHRASQGGQSVISQALLSQACYSHPGTTPAARVASRPPIDARRATYDAPPSPRSVVPTAGMLSKLSQLAPPQLDPSGSAAADAASSAPASPRKQRLPGPMAIKSSWSAGTGSPMKSRAAGAAPHSSNAAQAPLPPAPTAAKPGSARPSDSSELSVLSFKSSPAGSSHELVAAAALASPLGPGHVSSRQAPTALELEQQSADSLHLLRVALNPPDAKDEHLGVDPTRKWRFNTKAGKASNVQYMYVCKQSKYLYNT